ncbi:LOW QUALITY PROTEIN: uncharacterized protein PS065_008015 [Dugong dugon]
MNEKCYLKYLQRVYIACHPGIWNICFLNGHRLFFASFLNEPQPASQACQKNIKDLKKEVKGDTSEAVFHQTRGLAKSKENGTKHMNTAVTNKKRDIPNVTNVTVKHIQRCYTSRICFPKYKNIVVEELKPTAPSKYQTETAKTESHSLKVSIVGKEIKVKYMSKKPNILINIIHPKRRGNTFSLWKKRQPTPIAKATELHLQNAVRPQVPYISLSVKVIYRLPPQTAHPSGPPVIQNLKKPLGNNLHKLSQKLAPRGARTSDGSQEEAIDQWARRRQEKRFYMENFHSAAWVFGGDDENQEDSLRCLSKKPPPVAGKDSTLGLFKGNGDYSWGFQIQFSKPAMVIEVDANSATEDAGLQIGDVLAVNSTEVTSVEHAEAVHLTRRDILTLVVGSDISRCPNTPWPTCHGYLHKRTCSRFVKGWRKRWFIRADYPIGKILCENFLIKARKIRTKLHT